MGEVRKGFSILLNIFQLLSSWSKTFIHIIQSTWEYPRYPMDSNLLSTLSNRTRNVNQIIQSTEKYYLGYPIHFIQSTEKNYRPIDLEILSALIIRPRSIIHIIQPTENYYSRCPIDLQMLSQLYNRPRNIIHVIQSTENYNPCYPIDLEYYPRYPIYVKYYPRYPIDLKILSTLSNWPINIIYIIQST